MADAAALGILFADLARVLVLLLAGLLLWIRPPDRARTLLAFSFIAGTGTAIYDLRPVLPGLLVGSVFDASVALSSLFLALFLARYPFAPQRGSTVWAVHAACCAYLALAVIARPLTVDIATTDTGLAGILSDALFQPYAAVPNLAIVVSIIASLVRVQSLPADGRRSGLRILTALAGASLLFAGYTLLEYPSTYLGLLHHARYHITTDFASDPTAPLRIGLEFALLLVFAVRNRQRLAWLFVGLGALALILDQFSRKDIIDLGLPSLIPPLVILAETTRHGGLGVRRIPARASLLIAAIAGMASWLLVIDVAALVSGGDAFALSVGLILGLAVGTLVAYQVRPRAVRIALAPTSSPDAPAQPPRYRIVRPLASGGQGATFLAEDTKLGRTVVLKHAPASAEREARILASLDHPNVVRIHDVVAEEGRVTLVLEYMEGGDLRGALRRRGALPEREAVALTSGMLAGLAAVHARGLVHGDLKPENVLLAADGTPKLADFGTARVAGGALLTAVETTGTLLYMAPEQVRGEAPTRATDLFATGLILGELLTGRPLRDPQGLDDFGLRARILAGEQPPSVGRLDRVLARAVAGAQEDRYASAEEMRAALVAA